MATLMARVGKRLIGVMAALAIVQNAAAQPAETPILLADDTKQPHITVSWPTRSGEVVTIEGDRRYQSSAQKTPLGKGIDCYVALGGTRLNKGMAHRDGAGVLVGLYKADAKRPFFEDIADKASITITLSRVFMTQPVVPRPKSALMHVRYMMEDLAACGLSGNARNLFNTADPEDPIKERAQGASARFGALDGKGDDHGSVEAKTEADGSVTYTVKFPYALLRHTQDPYQRSNPGGFFEPNHFHVEIELIPKVVAEREAAAPPKPESKPDPKPEPKPEAKPEPR